jgi:hypothetical protein
MARKGILSFAVSILISGLLIGWLIRQIDLSLLTRTLSSLHAPALAAFAATSLVGALLRAWRYKWLLLPAPIGWGPVLMVTFIRNLFVDLLPARIGSLSYIYVLNRRLGFPFETAASTFVVAVVLDFLTLGPFLAGSLLAVGLASSFLSSPALLGLSLAFLAAMSLLLARLVPFFSWIMRRLDRLLRRLRWREKPWAEKIMAKSQATVDALDGIQERGITRPLIGISLLIRLAKYGALFFLLFALLHFHGFSLRMLSLPKTILGITGAEFTSILPVKGLAGFGTWESAWALSFRLMDFDPQLAIVTGIGVHLLTNLFEYALGILALLLIFSPPALSWMKRRPQPPHLVSQDRKKEPRQPPLSG